VMSGQRRAFSAVPQFPLLRNRGLRALAMTVLSVPLARRPPVQPASPSDRAVCSEDFEAQQRLIAPERDVVIKRPEAHRFEFLHAPRSPLVQELTYEAERVDLIIMLARRKREQLCFQVCQPWRAGGHVQAV